MRNLVFGIVLLIATPARAETDYLEAGKGLDTYARVLTSIGSCDRFGYEVTRDPDVIANRALNEAIMAGMDVSTAKALLKGAYEREDASQRQLSKTFGSGATSVEQLLADMRTYLTYWAGRCKELADDPVVGGFIRHTTPEREQAAFDEQQRKFQAMVDAEVKKRPAPR